MDYARERKGTVRRATRTLLLAAAVALILPTQARADGFVEPFAGTNWGSDINNGRGVVGASAGYMGAGIIGGEFDFGFSPKFFGSKSDFGNNSVITAMGNLIVGIPVGGTFGPGVRPYASGGIGLFRSQVENNNNVFDVVDSTNDFGWNAGAGVMGYFSQHVGLRGDIRYLRSTDDHGAADGLHFWRLTAGVTFR